MKLKKYLASTGVVFATMALSANVLMPPVQPITCPRHKLSQADSLLVR